MMELPSDVCERCSFVDLIDKNVSSAAEMQGQIEIQHNSSKSKTIGMCGHVLNFERAVQHKILSIL